MSEIGCKLEKKFSKSDTVLCGHFHHSYRSGKVYFMPDYGAEGVFVGYQNGIKEFKLENGQLIETK